jgi:hypothetical protein
VKTPTSGAEALRAPSRINRRTFLKTGACGAALVVSAGGAASYAQPAAGALPDTAYRILGRTGLRVTAVSIGTLLTTEPAVIQFAFDQGVNYLDTARIYQDGKNEEYVCEALKGYRDKVFVSTKVLQGDKETMVRSIETSLSKLGTDYVDILFAHHLETREQVLDPVTIEALTEARTQGKARFIGVSTHKNEPAVLDAMVEEKGRVYDAAMVTYSFKSDPAVKAAIARAAQAGIGIVGMKTQAGGYQTKELGDISPHQAALKWVLLDPNVHTTVPSMVSLDQIKENVAVMCMDLRLSRAEEQVLETYGRAIADRYCHRCAACVGTCPNGVDIPTVNRCLMYAEGYRDLALARAAYAEPPRDASLTVPSDANVRHDTLAACARCDVCVARCGRGVDLERNLRRARALFA